MRSIESMKRAAALWRRLPLLALMGALLFTACDADSPTEPEQPSTPVPTPAPTALALRVAAEPNAIEIATTPIDVLIRATATRSDNGQAAPDNATVILSTTIGSFLSTAADGTETMDRSVVVRTLRGQATALLRFIPGEVGTAVIQGQLNSAFSQTVVNVQEFVAPPGPPPPAPFFLAEVVPNAGPPEGGYIARIVGSGFSAPFRVLFGGTPAPVRGFTDTTLEVEVPPFSLAAGQIQAVSVSVTINLNDTDPEAQSTVDTLPNAFTYARGGTAGPQQPLILSVSPTSGANEGGTEVTIRGEGFGNEVQVFLSGGALVEAQVLSVSPNRIVIQTPAATGSNFANQNSIVDVRVRNLSTGQEATLQGGFQYGDGAGGQGMFISSAGPGRGPYTGGTVVTLFGSGFEEPVSISFGGFAQEKISVTGTEIIGRSVKVPLNNCQPVSGPFGVTNIETGEGFTSNIDFTYEPILVSIGGISPSSVTTDLNGNVTGPGSFNITGVRGFDTGDPVTVTFDDVLAFGVSFDPATSTIVGQTPPFTGTFEEVMCGANNTGTALSPARVDVLIRNEFTGCEVNLTSRFTYEPPFDCVEPPPPPPPPGNPPSASFTVSPVGDIAVGASAFFTNTTTGDPPIAYQWNFGDGTTSTATDPSHSYAAPGSFNVTLIATNAAGSSNTSATVTVVP